MSLKECGGQVNWINELSLTSGPLPVIFQLLGAAAVVFLLVRRSLRWWLFAAATAAASWLASMAACWAVIHVLYWWPEDLPAAVIGNLALALWVVVLGSTTALAGLRRRRSSRSPRPGRAAGNSALRRGLSVASTLVVLLLVGVQINAVFGQYPTVGSVLDSQPAISTAAPPAVQYGAAARDMSTPVRERWTAPAGLGTSGTILSAAIPGTVSGFKARNAVVYLPPAYFTTVRPVLPVLVLVSGQPGSPESWLRSSTLVQELDAFAAAHGGVAPLVVIPDPNGSEEVNTMCMDSDLARAGTYMSQDVPAWIKTHLDADTNPAHWAVGGFSYGGTCTMQMVTRHPGVYQTFMSISPEREPALAIKRTVTVGRAFHGDTAAFDALLPLTLMAHNKFPEIHGWFASGRQDAAYSANVRVLEAAGRRSGMRIGSALFDGGHSWSVVNAALPQGLSFVFSRIGLE